MFRATHFALVAGGLALLASSPAWSGAKPHCRDLTFAGSAGAASNDKVTLRMVDSGGNGVDDSCQLQVRNNESAKDFAARLVGAWGPGTGSPCLEPDPLPKKTCGNASFGTRSCKHQFKFKADKTTTLDPSDGLIRVRICCFDGADCKGPKMLSTPVSVQTKVDPAITFGPVVPPPVGISVTPVALDPIGVTQQPFAALQTCRTALGVVVSKLSSTGAMTLAACHRDRMQGFIPPTTDCNTFSLASDPAQRTAFAAQAVREVATGTCAAGGQTPESVGYGAACPCPCQHVRTCSAGRIGQPCSSDIQCDLLPGGGDGRCTLPGWNLAAACAVCLVETGITRAIAGTYGVPGPPLGLPPNLAACEDTLGQGLAELIRVHLIETASCQRQVDAGSLALPGNTSCRDGDPKHRRSAAETKTAAMIAAACPPGTLPPLLGCAATPDPVGCVLARARAAAASATGAVFPETNLALPCSPGGAFLDAID